MSHSRTQIVSEREIVIQRHFVEPRAPGAGTHSEQWAPSYHQEEYQQEAPIPEGYETARYSTESTPPLSRPVGSSAVYDDIYDRDLVGPASTRPRPNAWGRESCEHALRPRYVYWEVVAQPGDSCAERAEAAASAVVSKRRPAVRRDMLVADDASVGLLENELSFEQVTALLDSVQQLDSKLILGGLDPLRRADIFDIIHEAQKRGVSVAVRSHELTGWDESTVERLAAARVHYLGVCVDPEPHLDEEHEHSEAVARAFQVMRWAKKHGLRVHVATSITKHSLRALPGVYQLLKTQFTPPVVHWTLLGPVPGKERAEEILPRAHDMENLYAWLHSTTHTSPFHITAIEVPMYQRYLVQRMLEHGTSLEQVMTEAQRLGLGMRDGNGIVFISHEGVVSPSDFLPMTLGNIKEAPLEQLYRESPELLALRNPDSLHGRCGHCEYRALCGGSRARAASVYGDMFAEDPLCSYEPPSLQPISPASQRWVSSGYARGLGTYRY